MFKVTGGMMAAFAAGLLVAGTCAVRAQQTTGEKVGSQIDRAAGSVKRGAERVGEGVREGFDKVRGGVHKMGVESRVYGRLHWDKALTDSAINLEMRDPTTVILRGSVRDEVAKMKAATLARDTVGVTAVVNELAVSPGTTTTTTKP